MIFDAAIHVILNQHTFTLLSYKELLCLNHCREEIFRRLSLSVWTCVIAVCDLVCVTALCVCVCYGCVCVIWCVLQQGVCVCDRCVWSGVCYSCMCVCVNFTSVTMSLDVFLCVRGAIWLKGLITRFINSLRRDFFFVGTWRNSAHTSHPVFTKRLQLFVAFKHSHFSQILPDLLQFQHIRLHFSK